MAEGVLLLRSADQANVTMGGADRLLDSPSDIASQSEHDDDDDERERDPDYIEDRFRVDRRKLELMIQGGYRRCVVAPPPLITEARPAAWGMASEIVHYCTIV